MLGGLQQPTIVLHTQQEATSGLFIPPIRESQAEPNTSDLFQTHTLWTPPESSSSKGFRTTVVSKPDQSHQHTTDLELADIFREYGPAYRAKYGDRMLESHLKAMEEIEFCRTQSMGGHVYYCDACDENVYAYHSCGNRHCPKCGSDRSDDWRDKQLQKLLPVNYFLVTCTLPHTLNETAHSNQKLIYRLLFQTSADALQTLALNPEWLGGQIGMVGALHTWDRSMGYHLHVHYVVPAGGIDPNTGEWKEAQPKFLMPGSALSEVFRAKFRDALKATAPNLCAQVPSETWQKTWSVHCKPVGDGRTALKYLAPYIYRVALSNRRLVSMNDGKVVFSYKPRNKPWTTMTLDTMSFIQRFLQHVLPQGFQKVRYFGFLHPSAKTRFSALKQQLEEHASEPIDTPASQENTTPEETATNRHTPEEPGVCPNCGAPLRYIGRVPRCPAIEAPPQNQRGPPCKER